MRGGRSLKVSNFAETRRSTHRIIVAPTFTPTVAQIYREMSGVLGDALFSDNGASVHVLSHTLRGDKCMFSVPIDRKTWPILTR